MEFTELIKSFRNIIEDSFTDQNKIGKIDKDKIFNELDNELIEYFQSHGGIPFDYTQSIKAFVDIVRLRKPGYVITDLINIVKLGIDGQLGEDKVFCLDSLKKWFFEYGVKRKKIDGKDIGTRRNQWLGNAYQEMQDEKYNYY